MVEETAVAAGIETSFASYLAPLPVGFGQALMVSERVGLALATVMARAGKAAMVIDTMRDHYGFAPVNRACRVAAHGKAMIGIGPGNWLYTDDAAHGGGDGAAVATLADRLAGVASVFDQSSGYGVLRIEGSAAAALIGKGAFIDLHPAAFPPGSSAVTVIAHIDAILWRLDEDVFEIAIFRSFAGSFWHWLATAAAAMGIAPSRPDPFQHSGDENARG